MNKFVNALILAMILGQIFLLWQWIDLQTKDRFSLSDMKQWCTKVMHENEDFICPEPRHYLGR